MIFLNVIYAQKIVVDYELLDNGNYIESNLTVYNEFSIYTQFLSRMKERNETTGDEYNSKTLIISPNKDLHYIKNYKEEKVFYKSGIFNKKVFVTDSLNIFNWKIESDTLSILGLRCQKARLNFRGRVYEAYFTNEIKISDGPWKFNGLPGLILKIKSIDGIYSFEAKSIVRNPTHNFNYDEFLSDYRKDRREMNFKDFAELRKQKLKEYYEKQLSEYEEKSVITKISGLEVFFVYPENDKL